MNFRLACFLCASLPITVGCTSTSVREESQATPSRHGAAPVRLCDAPCEEFARFDEAVQTLTFDDDHVFAVVGGGTESDLVAIPADGGASTKLASSVSSFNVAVANGFVFFGAEHGLARVPVGGGRREIVALGHGPSILGIVADATDVVASTEDPPGTPFDVVSLDGEKAPEIQVGDPQTNPVPLFLDAENVYWDDVLESRSLRASPRDGGPPRVLIRTNDIISVAFDDTFAYVAEGGTDEKGHIDGAILEVPLAGGPPTTLLAIDNLPGSIESTTGLAIDTAFLYFALGGTVSALPKTGGKRVPFADVDAIYVAASKTHVYFVPRADPTMLLRQPKLAP